MHAEGRLVSAEGVGDDLGGAELDSCVQEVESTCYDLGEESERNIYPCEEFLQCKQQLGQLKIQGVCRISTPGSSLLVNFIHPWYLRNKFFTNCPHSLGSEVH